MYLVRCNGSMLIISGKYTAIAWSEWLSIQAPIIKQVFSIHVRTPSEFVIGINTQVSGLDLATAVEIIVKHIYEIDDVASIAGRFDWTGDDIEDSGYAEVVNRKVDIFLRVAVFVPEDHYATVMNLIQKYLASDMQEFIAEGVKDGC